jgi:hypothetical protein
VKVKILYICYMSIDISTRNSVILPNSCGDLWCDVISVAEVVDICAIFSWQLNRSGGNSVMLNLCRQSRKFACASLIYYMIGWFVFSSFVIIHRCRRIRGYIRHDSACISFNCQQTTIRSTVANMIPRHASSETCYWYLIHSQLLRVGSFERIYMRG